MAHAGTSDHRSRLREIAHRVMLERGLQPDFPPGALKEVEAITQAPPDDAGAVRDLRGLLWCSIDNSDSRDLDQLTVAEELPGGAVRIQVAIADVDALVAQGTALDDHARTNTTSVYTPAVIFPMLPEKLSTDLTSLGYAEDRLAMVTAMVVAGDGSIGESGTFRGLVRNHAKLAYPAVAAWLEGTGPMPPGIEQVKGLAETLRLQDRAAQTLKGLRHRHGALNLETFEARPVFEADTLRDVVVERQDRAKDIIEDFMIAANGAAARFLASRGFSSLHRIVRRPKRWERIVQLAAVRGTTLPAEPDAGALERFLVSAKAADPLHFPDLSLSVIKLLGPGEYAVDPPDGDPVGHFGLAVRDYTHSTAPNRRFPDLITQRLLKAAIDGSPSPYDERELEVLARHCTEAEDAAKKVERQVEKSAAAMLLESRIGQFFDAVVTGAAAKGTWVRLLQMPVEGRLVRGEEGMDVGETLRVQLVRADAGRGFLDFVRVR